MEYTSELIYEFQYQIKMKNQLHLFETIIQYTSLADRSFCDGKIIKKINRAQGWYSFCYQFFSIDYSTILQFTEDVLKIRNPYQLEDEILGILRSTIYKVANFHERGIYLCDPLEYCMLVNKGKKRIAFFHLGNPTSTYINVLEKKKTLSSS